MINDSNLKIEMHSNGVLIVEPQQALRSEDFDKLASVVDPWIETHNNLKGVVICIREFPGWENFASFIHHIKFVYAHHQKVKRVAIACNGLFPEIMTKLASHFVAAEVKQFPYEKSSDAIQWASE